MSLRIGWASPWNMRSSIALFGAEVSAELVARGHSVDVLRTETGDGLQLEARPAPGRIRALSEVNPGRLQREYDVIVVNLGDSHLFHGGVLRSFAGLGAVAILHDRQYVGLVSGAFATADSWPTLRRMVRATYGADAMPEGEPFCLPMPQMLESRSMLEWFAGPVISAVVHAGHYADRVRRVCPGPVATIPLAHADPGFPPPRPIGAELVVATVGHVNPNKCIDRVIAAIASSNELRARCRYRLIGPYEDAERQRLLALAAHLGVRPPEFLNWVADPDFPAALGSADVICCLRNPVLEGGSGSVIIGMLSGRPVLVSDHGAYAEIPDGLVGKCVPGDETVGVARHLRAILRNPATAQAMGRRAHDYALDRHSPRAYVDALLPFLDDAIAGGPAIMASIALGRTLASFGLDPDDPALARAVAPLTSMLGASHQEEYPQ